MRKVVCVVLIVAVLLTSALVLVACNDDGKVPSTGEFLKDVASIVKKPNFDDVFSDSGNPARVENTAEVLQKGVTESQKADGERDEEAIKDAVMLIYDTANYSRLRNEKNKTGSSLMVQRSLGGNSQGRVYMNGFTLQSGDKWYYQLASQATKGDVGALEWIVTAFKKIAGNLQVAYTLDSQKYNYAYIMGTDTQIDCSSNIFPYASFVIPQKKEPKEYESYEAFQADRNCRDGQLELNNMRIYRELLKDVSVEYNTSSAGNYYTIKFAIDCESDDREKLYDFQKNSLLDLDIGDDNFVIDNAIGGWSAELEVWDNGYAKEFRSQEDWGMEVSVVGIPFPVESHPSNAFVYLWNTNEILNVISQDERLATTLRAHTFESDEQKIEKCIEYYAAVSQDESEFVFDYFTFTLAFVGSVLGAIVIVVIVLAILFKKGKLPKLQAAIERDKARRKAIKAQDIEDKVEKKELKEEKKELKAEKRAAKKEETIEEIESVESADEESDAPADDGNEQ